MTRKEKNPSPPPSLVHLFEPPDGFRGSFGWICGYSADAAFLDLAAERFTHLTSTRRAHAGKIALVAMLDPGNPQIAPVDSPGVLHVPLRSDVERNFRLLHSKLAILGFTDERDADRWCLRLIVSTGNWTRQTLEESLDLAWRLDLDSTKVAESDDETSQAVADLRAAWSLLDDLRALFDIRVLSNPHPGHRESETEHAMRRLDQWVRVATRRENHYRPRFFDNREQSLLKQLPHLARSAAGAVARNYIALGSGFYEEASEARDVPEVPRLIIKHLQGANGGERLLTASPEVDVFVNPLACQAVATSVPAMTKVGWSVRPAYQPVFLGQTRRSLHAKFIFSANWREGSDNCASAWLYLGSGNLTAPGFTNPMHRDRGNLETGVVISASDHFWSQLPSVLPIQWDHDLNHVPDEVKAGASMDERPPSFFAPPVACFQYIEQEGTGWLTCIGETETEFSVLDLDGKPCSAVEGRGFSWAGGAPRQVRLRWLEDGIVRECEVPVLDRFGRIAGTVLQKLDLYAAWSNLADFPLPPPEEEVADDQPLPAGDSFAPRDGRRSHGTDSTYPIRAVMTLIENIAALQERLHPVDWTTWCSRLEQTLVLAGESETVYQCRALHLNVLSPLHRPEFRPDFALDNSSDGGRLYEEVLRRVEQIWGVDKLASIGAIP